MNAEGSPALLAVQFDAPELVFRIDLDPFGNEPLDHATIQVASIRNPVDGFALAGQFNRELGKVVRYDRSEPGLVRIWLDYHFDEIEVPCERFVEHSEKPTQADLLQRIRSLAGWLHESEDTAERYDATLSGLKKELTRVTAYEMDRARIKHEIFAARQSPKAEWARGLYEAYERIQRLVSGFEKDAK